jgi:hypothetical protein
MYALLFALCFGVIGQLKPSSTNQIASEREVVTTLKTEAREYITQHMSPEMLDNVDGRLLPNSSRSLKAYERVLNEWNYRSNQKWQEKKTQDKVFKTTPGLSRFVGSTEFSKATKQAMKEFVDEGREHVLHKLVMEDPKWPKPTDLPKPIDTDAATIEKWKKSAATDSVFINSKTDKEWEIHSAADIINEQARTELSQKIEQRLETLKKQEHQDALKTEIEMLEQQLIALQNKTSKQLMSAPLFSDFMSTASDIHKKKALIKKEKKSQSSSAKEIKKQQEDVEREENQLIKDILLSDEFLRKATQMTPQAWEKEIANWKQQHLKQINTANPAIDKDLACEMRSLINKAHDMALNARMQQLEALLKANSDNHSDQLRLLIGTKEEEVLRDAWLAAEIKEIESRPLKVWAEYYPEKIKIDHKELEDETKMKELAEKHAKVIKELKEKAIAQRKGVLTNQGNLPGWLSSKQVAFELMMHEKKELAKMAALKEAAGKQAERFSLYANKADWSKSKTHALNILRDFCVIS